MIFSLVTTPERATRHWKEVGSAVQFSEEAAPILRDFGDMYRFNALDPSVPDQPRPMTVDMTDFIVNVVARFERDWGKPAPKVSSPFATSADNAEREDEPGRFQVSATVLFAARVCPADCSTAVHRLLHSSEEVDHQR